MSQPHEEERIVRNLGEVMLSKLRANSHKRGWDEDKVSSLLDRLSDEVDELHEAYYGTATAEEIASECADVANFAAMIMDVTRERR